MNAAEGEESEVAQSGFREPCCPQMGNTVFFRNADVPNKLMLAISRGKQKLHLFY